MSSARGPAGEPGPDGPEHHVHSDHASGGDGARSDRASGGDGARSDRGQDDGQGEVGVSARRRSPVFLAIVGTLAVVFFLIFVALGTWQVKRRAWKLDLIARVEQRVHAPATPAPGPADWPHVTAAADEYRHVTATGTFLDSSQTLVQAVTDLGAGYWVLTPLREADGSLVLINRGFVAADDRGRVRPGAAPGIPVVGDSRASTGAEASPTAATSTVTVTGLLRMTEPTGAFLRHNNPGANLWYSRDVQAIAATRGLTNVAPYFIDAEAPPHDANAPGGNTAPDATTAGATTGDATTTDATTTDATTTDATTTDATTALGGAPAPGTPSSGGMPTPSGTRTPGATPALAATAAPTPGLTVIHFHNSHLVYAITWYTLALMTAIAIPLGMRKQ